MYYIQIRKPNTDCQGEVFLMLLQSKWGSMCRFFPISLSLFMTSPLSFLSHFSFSLSSFFHITFIPLSSSSLSFLSFILTALASFYVLCFLFASLFLCLASFIFSTIVFFFCKLSAASSDYPASQQQATMESISNFVRSEVLTADCLKMAVF